MNRSQSSEPFYNWIGGRHILNRDEKNPDQSQCALSLILSKHGEHAYILIESLNAKHEIEAVEAHLGTIGHKRANIEIIFTHLARLKSIAENNKARTWSITHAQKHQLLENINQDQSIFIKNEVPYVKAGEAKAVGLFGASLNASGLKVQKEASIEKNHSLLERDDNPSMMCIHDSVDALLQKGINCASWAKNHAKKILGHRYEETIWEKMAECVVVDPRIVINSSSWGCCLS